MKLDYSGMNVMCGGDKPVFDSAAFSSVIDGMGKGWQQWCDLPSDGEVTEIERFSAPICAKYDNVVVLGIGGSALGVEAIAGALLHFHHNELPKKVRKAPRLYVEDNIDPVRMKSLLDIIDIKSTLFVVITKSGETSETLAQFLIVYELLKSSLGDRASKHVVTVTTIGKGTLYEIAKREGFKTFGIGEGVGGRFSVFSPVGLVPLACVGIDISALIGGARAAREYCTDKSDNPAYTMAALLVSAYKTGHNISVIMPYSDSLRLVSDFYAQLWGESLGKATDNVGNVVHIGQTPVKALGVTDQHSQIQLYTEGPFDKVVTFIKVKKNKCDVHIPNDGQAELRFLKGKSLGELFAAECEATAFALKKAGRLNMTLEIDDVTPRSIGELLTVLMYSTAYAGALLNVNTYDQPGVEEGKKATFAMMGRDGYFGKLKEIAACVNCGGDYIIRRGINMQKKTIENVNVEGKKCLVRVDFNVPVSDGVITDDTRIRGALPTIEYLVAHNAKVVLCSHLGRPKGEFNLKYSLAPIAKRLSELLGREVIFCNDVIGEDAKKKVAALKCGEVALIENLRFHKEEEKNDKEFCRALSEFCEVYVNDAFGTAHRAHASTAGIVQYGFAPCAVAGFLIDKEIKSFDNVLVSPRRPLVAILGGAKVSDKIGVITNLIEKADAILIGGGMAYTFLKAKGLNIGKSLCEEDKLDLARGLMNKAESKNVKLLLPVDAVVAKEFPDPITSKVQFRTVKADGIGDDEMGLDIGEETVKLFSKEIASAGTVVWNGPMGVFENPDFACGTRHIAEAVASGKCISVVGGGDSVAAVQTMGLSDGITHISTGGGAGLEYLEGKILPGIDCLDNK